MSVSILALLLFAASQIATPGPANMVLLATGAKFGFRAVVPFVAGVIAGKQMLIWPIGFGLMEIAEQVPNLFVALKYLSAGYILWLAWRVANLRLNATRSEDEAPGFAAGLAVHPLNPKAWAMIIAGFTNFVEPGALAFNATVTLAGVFLACQCVLHPIWAYSGDRIAIVVAGQTFEPYVMRLLAVLTAFSVLVVLI
ncbi:MAG: LysE family translocator [Paracoccaceae bacterium]